MSLTEPRFSPSGSGAIENAKVKWNAPSVLVGIGYRQPITDNSSLYIMGMYDVLQHEYSPYRGGIFPRIGFNIGFYTLFRFICTLCPERRSLFYFTV